MFVKCSPCVARQKDALAGFLSHKGFLLPPALFIYLSTFIFPIFGANLCSVAIRLRVRSSFICINLYISAFVLFVWSSVFTKHGESALGPQLQSGVVTGSLPVL